MTDHTNIGSLRGASLQNFDFSSRPAQSLVGNENLNTLLNCQGVFSLDDQGKLIVVNPPARRDNCVVRFFKSISPSYRAQQRILDRLPALQQNASFSLALRSAIRSSQNQPDMQPTQQKMLALRLKTAFINAGNNITTEQIKNSVQSGKSQLAPLAGKIADSAQLQKTSGPGIAFGGKSVTIAEFVRDHAPQAEIPDDRTIITSIMSRAAISPQSLRALEPGRNGKSCADTVSRLMKKPQLSQKGLIGLEENVSRLAQLYKGKLCDFANQALAAGKSPEAVAAKLAGMCRDLFDFNAASNGKTAELLGPGSQHLGIDDLPPAPDAQGHASIPDDAPHKQTAEAIRHAYPQLDALHQAQITEFCIQNNVSAEEYIKYDQEVRPQLAKGVSTLLIHSEQDYAPLSIFAVQQNIAKVLTAAHNGEAPDDHDRAAILKCAAHAALMHGKPLDAGELRSLRDYANALTAAGSEQNTEEFRAVCGMLEDITKAMLTAQLQGRNGTAVYNTEAAQPEQVTKNITSLQAIAACTAPEVQNRINEAVALYFPEDQREQAAKMVMILLQSRASDAPFTFNLGQEVMRLAHKIGSENGGYIGKIFSTKAGPEHMQKYVKQLLETPGTGILDSIPSQKKHIDANGYHKVFDRDVIGTHINSFDGVVLSKTCANNQQMIEKAHQIMDDKVPARMKPFVTTLMMQGGIAQNIISAMQMPNAVHSMEDQPSIMDMTKHGLNMAGSAQHDITFDGDEMIIRTRCDFSLEVLKTYDKHNVSSLNNKIQLKPVELETRVNLKAELDENGVPTSGFSIRRL